MSKADEINKRAIILIDKMYRDGKNENEIFYKIGLEYGKGELFCKRRMKVVQQKMARERGIISDNVLRD